MSVWHNGARVRVFPTRRWQNRSNQGEQMRKVVFQGAVCRVNVLVRHRRRADCGNTANQAAAGRASDKQESECGDVQSAGAGLSCSPAAARQRPWLPRVGSLPRMSIVVGAGRTALRTVRPPIWPVAAVTTWGVVLRCTGIAAHRCHIQLGYSS